MILGMKRHFSLKWNLLFFKLQLQSFLIARLIKSWSQLPMHLMHCTNDIINMFLKRSYIQHDLLIK